MRNPLAKSILWRRERGGYQNVREQVNISMSTGGSGWTNVELLKNEAEGEDRK